MSNKNKFLKKALNLNSKIEFLEEKGLLFNDKNKSKKYLQNI
jgi:hypothetical protein